MGERSWEWPWAWPHLFVVRESDSTTFLCAKPFKLIREVSHTHCGDGRCSYLHSCQLSQILQVSLICGRGQDHSDIHWQTLKEYFMEYRVVHGSHFVTE